MFSPDRNSMRRVYFDTWRKYQNREPLQPLEQLVADVIRQHPEYHRLMVGGNDALDRDFRPEDGETNPFLHMSMHISLQEQVSSDRPRGIRSVYRQLVAQVGDTHEAEHRMMECLGLSLWEAQRAGRAPEENTYMGCLRRLSGSD